MLCEIRIFESDQDDGESLYLGDDAEIADSDEARALPDLDSGASTQRLLLARTPVAALDECVRLRSVLDAAPGLIAVVDGPDHIFQFANSAWLKVVEGDVIGRAVRDVLPQAQAHGLLKLLDSIQAGAHDVTDAGRHTMAVLPMGLAEPVYLDFLCRPMIGPDGALQGVVLQGTDVTERVLALEWQHLLTNELAHRVKNTSATVLGLARLARGSATDLDAFLTALTDRIVAMCKTQDMLSIGRNRPIQVGDLLHMELAPYLDQGGESRVDVVCQDLTLAAGSAASLSMIVHELLTNALKYGALSGSGGRLHVSCEAVGRNALLLWSETTAQPVPPMGKRGFGSRLIERLARSLGGRLRFESRSDGLDVAVTFTVEAAATNP